MQSLSFRGMLKLITRSTDLISRPLAARSVVTSKLVFQFLKFRRWTILLVCFIMECRTDTLQPSFLRVKQIRWDYLQVLTNMITLEPVYSFRTVSKYPFLRPEGMNRYLWIRVGTVIILSYVEYFLSWRCYWLRMDFSILPQNLLSIVAVSNISCLIDFIPVIIVSMSSNNEGSKSLSASSSTKTSQLETYFWKVQLFYKSWATRPGVPTTMCGMLSSSWFCFRQLVPPISNACLRFRFWPKIASCQWICTANSRQGTITTQNIPQGSLESLWSRGKAKAAVLPLPVIALAMMLYLLRMGLKQRVCISVGCLQPILSQTFRSQLSSPMVLNSMPCQQQFIMGVNQRLQQLFISYGSYHHNIVNKVIHIICIPLILISLFALTHHIKVASFKGYDLPLSFIIYALVMAYYLRISIPIGIVCSGVYFLGWYGQKYLYDLPLENFFWKAAAVHTGAWILQFIGHGVFQKRKPALLDNITQVLSAPLFVVVEIMCMFSMKTFRESVEARIDKNVKAFKEKELAKTRTK